MSKKAKTVQSIPLFRNAEEADDALREINDAQRRIQERSARLQADIDALKEQASAELQPLEEGIGLKVIALYLFATKNRDALTKDGETKTIKLPSGTLAWRTTPPKVDLKLKVETVIEKIKEMKLGKLFLRVAEEIDKQAMLKDPEKARTVPGVRIAQREEFYVKPDASGEEVAEAVEKLERARAA
jgi:phage host-nuclease inhibitor protein Gam